MSIEPSEESFVAKYHRMKQENENLNNQLDAMSSEAMKHATEAGKLEAELSKAYATIHTLADLLRKDM